MPLGVAVEARLNGARAGKVSVQQGLTKEEVSQLHGRMTLNTAFHNVLKEKKGGGGATFPKKKKEHRQEMLKEKDKRHLSVRHAERNKNRLCESIVQNK